MKAKPLFPNQSVTAKGDGPSQELVEVIDRIVSDLKANEDDIQANDAAIAAIVAQTTNGTWTPTITTSSGTITTLGTVEGIYNRIGSIVYVTIDIRITTNGTGAGNVQATLPLGVDGRAILIGKELNVTGSAITGSITAAPDKVTILTYNNAYPGGDGYRLFLSGWYRVA